MSEPKAVNEGFFTYVLECLSARIQWIPFKQKIARYLPDETIKNSEKDVYVINYQIMYKLPCLLGVCISYKPKVEFDFWALTINELISTFKLKQKEQYMWWIDYHKLQNKNKIYVFCLL